MKGGDQSMDRTSTEVKQSMDRTSTELKEADLQLVDPPGFRGLDRHLKHTGI